MSPLKPKDPYVYFVKRFESFTGIRLSPRNKGVLMELLRLEFRRVGRSMLPPTPRGVKEPPENYEAELQEKLKKRLKLT
jgi:hypothetical protein